MPRHCGDTVTGSPAATHPPPLVLFVYSCSTGPPGRPPKFMVVAYPLAAPTVTLYGHVTAPASTRDTMNAAASPEDAA